MKKLGVERLISVSSAGSMKEHIAPGDLLVANQFVDHTYARKPTFFGDGIVAHVSLADPVCADLSRELVTAGREAGAKLHDGGTYICVEGPQFSTRAESNLYRSWGADVIGMTNLQEAKLAREAEICYATMAMVTDYDCWREGHDDVTVDQVVAVLHQNAENAAKVVRAAVAAMPKERKCACADALKYAILTDRAVIPAATKEKLAPLLGKYL
jgi:5'-methylthioadenosine phosphorylase